MSVLEHFCPCRDQRLGDVCPRWYLLRKRQRDRDRDGYLPGELPDWRDGLLFIQRGPAGATARRHVCDVFGDALDFMLVHADDPAAEQRMVTTRTAAVVRLQAIMVPSPSYPRHNERALYDDTLR